MAADETTTHDHEHDPTLDPATCRRFDRIEQALAQLSTAAGFEVQTPTVPTIDIADKLAAIERAETDAIEAVQNAGRLAVEGLRSLMDEAQAAPVTVEEPPPAPPSEASSGWVKSLTARVDEEMADEAPRPIAVTPDEWGKAEIRYQVALQALNGSAHAKAMMAEAAARRDVSVEALAQQIVEARRKTERDVMAEF